MLAAAREFASTPPQTHPRAQHLAWIFHTRSADFQSAVSQNCILRAVGNAQDAEPLRTPCRLKIGDTPDYKSALRRWQQPRRDIAFHRRPRPCEMFGLSTLRAAILGCTGKERTAHFFVSFAFSCR